VGVKRVKRPEHFSLTLFLLAVSDQNVTLLEALGHPATDPRAVITKPHPTRKIDGARGRGGGFRAGVVACRERTEHAVAGGHRWVSTTYYLRTLKADGTQREAAAGAVSRGI
jgi:hypothetical protein